MDSTATAFALNFFSGIFFLPIIRLLLRAKSNIRTLLISSNVRSYSTTHRQMRCYYTSTIKDFRGRTENEIVGELSRNSDFADEVSQKNAWVAEIEILKTSLSGLDGRIFLEYSIPRMGRRVDAVLIIANVVFVLEFKVGETAFLPTAIDQVWDYALDLKNFHEKSHTAVIAPILVATEATRHFSDQEFGTDADGVISPPLKTNALRLREVINGVLNFITAEQIDHDAWQDGRYSPTPTIIEAATALYRKHSVADISRTDASARNLRITGSAVNEIIRSSQENQQKSICFVTGVPGAGKTLVGLDIATRQSASTGGTPSVFLSGNGPLVAILREALARDSVARAKERNRRLTKGEAVRRVKSFIQNVHHYRDEYLADDRAPADHVAIFDEAQRAWNLTETARFMRQKKNRPDFNLSEPEFLISCLDRHDDWAVIICLVGGGQEINRGEAGIGEWIDSLNRSFPKWNIYISDRLKDSGYAAGHALEKIKEQERVHTDERLHLSVSMRSYRAENVSAFVKAVLDQETESAAALYEQIKKKYPLFLTRQLSVAKEWLRKTARGSERFGLLASSSAERLKAKSINVKAPMKPVNWFLEGKHDVRSSYFLEDAATEFHCQSEEHTSELQSRL